MDSRENLINQNEIYFQLGNPNQEVSMRFHDSPVHDQHAFIRLIRMVGPKPEFQLLADFIKFTRKTYQNGKTLRRYVENLGNLKHVKIFHSKAIKDLYELKILYKQMIDFVHDPPSILFEIQHEETLEQLQNYFDPSTQLHQQFLNPILFWVEKAAGLLAEGSENSSVNNSLLNESFNTTHNEFPNFGSTVGFSALDTETVIRPLNSDQVATLDPTQPSGDLTRSGGVIDSDQPNQLGVTQQSGPLTHRVESERNSKVTAANKVRIDETFKPHDTFRLDDTLKGRETFNDLSQKLKAVTMSYPEGKVPSLQPGPRMQGIAGDFTGGKDALKFTDNFPHALSLNNKDVNMQGYSRITLSETKDNFTIDTPRKSEILNNFTAGLSTKVVSSLPAKSVFLPPESFTSQSRTQPQPTLKPNFVPLRQPITAFTSQQPTLEQHQPPSQVSPPLQPSLYQPSGPQSRHFDISRVSPRILQLELSTLVSDIGRLKNKILALHNYATGLGSANETSNNTLREYTKDAIKLTDRSSKLFDRFDTKINIETRNIMENIFTCASDLTEQLSTLHPVCSTDLVSPTVSASLLKNVKIPRLNASTWVSPGFYCQARDLLNHIDTNRFQPRYYVDQVMGDLKQNERIIWQSIKDGPYTFFFIRTIL